MRSMGKAAFESVVGAAIGGGLIVVIVAVIHTWQRWHHLQTWPGLPH